VRPQSDKLLVLVGLANLWTVNGFFIHTQSNSSQTGYCAVRKAYSHIT
jgi:hypothetical protein